MDIGDYDEVGIILHAYTPGNGGGHVYNYIRDGGNTYIVDFSWYIFADYRAENDFPVMKLTSLEEYGNRVNELYQDVCLVLAHTSEGQHYPNVFSDETEPGTAVYGLPAGVKYTVLYRSGRSGDYQVGEYPLGQHSLNWTVSGDIRSECSFRFSYYLSQCKKTAPKSNQCLVGYSGSYVLYYPQFTGSLAREREHHHEI